MTGPKLLLSLALTLALWALLIYGYVYFSGDEPALIKMR